MIATLSKTCEELRAQINTAKRETTPMLEEAAALQSVKQETESKQNVLDAFSKHFIISDEDLSALTSTIEPVKERYYAVLARVKQIHKDCQVLLGSENQTLGVELMDQTSRNLDAAFKKLYQWIQREFKALDLEDPHISGSIRRALRVLAERPSLFQNCQDFFAEAREHTLSEAFNAALTEAVAGKERSGSTKPIEFSTHDLLRYLGDMLAWVHSAAVSERESLEGLFVSDGDEIARGMKAGKDTDPWTRFDSRRGETEDREELAFDGASALNDLVNRNLASVVQTLRQRVEVAIRNNDDPVLVYKALGLLRFYSDIFAKLLGPDSRLPTTLQDLEDTTSRHFDQVLTNEVGSIQDEEVPVDLSIPASFDAALSRTRLILRDAASDDEASALLIQSLSPFLNHCQELVADIPDPMQSSIFRLNLALAIRTRLPNISEVSWHHLAIDPIALESAIQTQQQAFLLERTGLAGLEQHLLSTTSEGSIDISILEDAATRLDDFLPTAQMDALENVRYISNKGVAKQRTENAIEAFCKVFERIEEVVDVHDERVQEEGGDGEQGDEGDEAAGEVLLYRSVFPRTSAELRVLLS